MGPEVCSFCQGFYFHVSTCFECGRGFCSGCLYPDKTCPWCHNHFNLDPDEDWDDDYDPGYPF